RGAARCAREGVPEGSGAAERRRDPADDRRAAQARQPRHRLDTQSSRTRDSSVVTIDDVPNLLIDRRRLLALAVAAAVLFALAGRVLLRPRHASAPPPIRVAPAAAAASKPALVFA